MEAHDIAEMKLLAEQFICHSVSRGIDEVERAGELMLEAAAALNEVVRSSQDRSDDLSREEVARCAREAGMIGIREFAETEPSASKFNELMDFAKLIVESDRQRSRKTC